MRAYDLPDARGHFGPYDGVFVAETLMQALEELKQAYEKYRFDPDFQAEFTYDLKHYVGRALDNRMGGFMIAQVARLLKEKKVKLPFGLYITNSVQEEVGLRGAEMIVERIKPDHTKPIFLPPKLSARPCWIWSASLFFQCWASASFAKIYGASAGIFVIESVPQASGKLIIGQ